MTRLDWDEADTHVDQVSCNFMLSNIIAAKILVDQAEYNVDYYTKAHSEAQKAYDSYSSNLTTSISSLSQNITVYEAIESQQELLLDSPLLKSSVLL